MIEPFPGKIRRKRGKMNQLTYVLNKKQKAWLAHYFPMTETQLIADVAGVSRRSIERVASRLGLEKSKEGLHQIMLRAGQKTANTLRKSGYYDTLKHRTPSAATIAGTHKMWEEIRAGIRPHPLQIVKEKDPDRYQKFCENAKTKRLEILAGEKRRNELGIPRKTRLRLPSYNYTDSQRQHRYNALRKGYFVMADCTESSGHRYDIFYDADTSRSEIFERNLEADGFNVKEWKEYV